MQKIRSRSRLSICTSASPQAPILLTLLFFLNSALVCPAAVIKVPENYSSIQSAINAAFDGDEIIVIPGTYYENIHFNGKNIILRSTDPTDSSIVSSTIIDGNRTGSVVTFSGSENENCVLSGFTITNGDAIEGAGIFGNETLATIQNSIISGNAAKNTNGYSYGGGLCYCDGTIRNNIVSDNAAGRSGGGLYCCNGTIQNNTISDNFAGDDGGGLYHCNGTIENNTIKENQTVFSGGGLLNCNGTIQNNTISGNSASCNGGGLYACNGTIQNNIISNNSADYGGGLNACGGTIRNNTIYGNSAQSRAGGLSDCNAAIRNCIIWNNTAPADAQLWDASSPSFSCIQDWTCGGIGNISDWPLLSDPDNGDFHLDYDSPCIDAGCYIDDLAEDFEGDSRGYDGCSEARGDGSDQDIGADEFIAMPSNHRPHKPFNSYPTNGEAGVSLPPTLESSAFSDPDPSDIHTASQWQIDNNSEFSSPEYDSYTDFFNKTSIIALSKDVICCTPYCYWRVRHRDNHGYWSEWSDSTSFLTTSPRVITVPGDYSTIQAAIDSAWGGDTINVSPGTYRENVNFNGKDIILRSNDPTSVSIVASTVIDGNTSGSVVTFSGTESALCVLSGFTITNGYARKGGGIYGNGTLATIQHNSISVNSAFYGGGLYDCDGVIQNNSICDNTAYWGGGLVNCYGSIQNNIILGNSAHHAGGMYECYGTIQNNTLLGNSADSDGGGMYNCRGRIINCIIWANSARDHSQLYSSSSPFYSCIQDWTGTGKGNISSDPQFVDPANGNYHLRPDSPCIDTGNTFYFSGKYIADIDGECRLAGTAVDMGSDEYNSSWDSDGDLVSDVNEAAQGSDPNNPDTDGDALIDGVEVLRGTSPLVFNTGSGISIPAQYSSIQQAVFLAFPGESVTLSPGIYYENLHFLGKNLALQSSNPFDDDIVNITIIDGDALFSVICFAGDENENCSVKGLTIRNGKAYQGGGICGNGTLATIEMNRILNNEDGGLKRCDGTIRYNSIFDNFAHYGGGLLRCNGNINNNTIIDNTAVNEGGGLYDCDGRIENNSIERNDVYGDFCAGGGLSHCDGIIQNNIISGNRSTSGSGGGLHNCNGTIQNNIISGNGSSGMSAWGGGLSSCNGTIQNNTIYGNTVSGHGKGGGLVACQGIIRNCIVWGNKAYTGAQVYVCSLPSYSCIQDWIGGGVGNIMLDPGVLFGYREDFHLRSNSPCIDSGCHINGLNEDFEGDARPWRSTSELRGDGSGFDIGADEFVGALHYEFPTSQEGWTSSTVEVFSAPQCVFEPGSLKLISQNNTNTFGYWVSMENAIPVTQDYLYRARFIISTNVTMPELVPEIRLRVNSSNLQQADCLIIGSNGDGGASPTPEGKTYDMYFVPPANDEYCMIAFDLLNFDPYDAARAELSLESVLVDRFSLDALDDYTTNIVTYDFETGQEYWSPGDGGFVFTNPEFLWDDGALQLRSTTNTNTFGYWHNDPIDVIIEADRLYRAAFEVRTDEQEQSCVPQMRLRFNTSNMQACRSLEIASVGDGANSPGITNTTYDMLYFWPPANCVGGGLIVSFDLLNFSPVDAPTASLILDRATIEALSPPTLP